MTHTFAGDGHKSAPVAPQHEVHFEVWKVHWGLYRIYQLGEWSA